MSNAVVSAFKNKQLRKKLLFTTLILIVVRFGSQLPIPEIDSAQISAYLKSTLGDSFSLLNSFTGGSFMQMSVFALSVTPYITSSIIMQLMTIVIPALEEMQKDGEDGRKRMAKITRYVTVVLAIIEGAGLAIGFANQGAQRRPLRGARQASRRRACQGLTLCRFYSFLPHFFAFRQKADILIDTCGLVCYSEIGSLCHSGIPEFLYTALFGFYHWGNFVKSSLRDVFSQKCNDFSLKIGYTIPCGETGPQPSFRT